MIKFDKIYIHVLVLRQSNSKGNLLFFPNLCSANEIFYKGYNV